jgi:hypothetical protein
MRPTQRIPNPSTGSGIIGGTRRVFEQFPGLKQIPTEWRFLVPPGCRLAQPCRETPAGILKGATQAVGWLCSGVG